jgi:hypothetical protein
LSNQELNLWKTKIWKRPGHFEKLKYKILVDALHKFGIYNSMAHRIKEFWFLAKLEEKQINGLVQIGATYNSS